jgi:hypothetical protein
VGDKYCRVYMRDAADLNEQRPVVKLGDQLWQNIFSCLVK